MKRWNECYAEQSAVVRFVALASYAPAKIARSRCLGNESKLIINLVCTGRWSQMIWICCARKIEFNGNELTEPNVNNVVAILRFYYGHIVGQSNDIISVYSIIDLYRLIMLCFSSSLRLSLIECNFITKYIDTIERCSRIVFNCQLKKKKQKKI